MYLKYLVCENRNWRHDKAVIHIVDKCYPQRAPGVTTLNTRWFGYYETLEEAIEKARGYRSHSYQEVWKLFSFSLSS